MAKITEEQKQIFEQNLFAMFPDTQTSGQVTRKQLLEVRESCNIEYHPLWLMQNVIGRGLYAIPSSFPDVHDVPAPAIAEPDNVQVGNMTLKKTLVASVDNAASLIPKKDPNFVPFGNFADLENIIKSKIFYPSYISGPTGNGKSTMVEQICAKHKRPLIRVNLNLMTDEDHLVGSKTLENGDVQIVEGPVLIAMRLGCTLLLDEIDAGGANTLLCLQPILEGKPYYFKLKNEIIVPTEGFNIIATANSKGKGSDDGRYIGTNVLNEAFLERFAVTFEQEYPSAKVEIKIIKNLMESYQCVDEEFAETLVKWAEAIRRTFDDGGVDETITTRRMTHIVRAYAIFKSRTKAVELCCNRFDSATKLAFQDLFEKVSTPIPEVVVAPQVQENMTEVPF